MFDKSNNARWRRRGQLDESRTCKNLSFFRENTPKDTFGSGFKMPQLETYDGTTNPSSSVQNYESIIDSCMTNCWETIVLMMSNQCQAKQVWWRRMNQVWGTKRRKQVKVVKMTIAKSLEPWTSLLKTSLRIHKQKLSLRNKWWGLSLRNRRLMKSEDL